MADVECHPGCLYRLYFRHGLYALRGGHNRTEPVEKSYVVFLLASMISIIALNVTNFASLRTAWPYLFSLLLTLTIAFLQFVRLLRGLWRRPTDAV